MSYIFLLLERDLVSSCNKGLFLPGERTPARLFHCHREHWTNPMQNLRHPLKSTTQPRRFLGDVGHASFSFYRLNTITVQQHLACADRMYRTH